MERLDKIVAVGGGVSRAVARRLILKSKVTVNGTTVRDIAFPTDPQGDTVCLEGQAIGYQQYVYYLLHKPAGVLTATTDKRQKTVLDLVPEEYRRKGLYPVGRLDKDTTGLLLLTNDGALGHTLLSPQQKIPKGYEVELDGEIPAAAVEAFAKGVILADGTKLSSAKLQVGSDHRQALVTITEGKYHQIKRMFGLFGLGVTRLKRVSFGGLVLPDDLPAGQMRPLTSREKECIHCAKKRTK